MTVRRIVAAFAVLLLAACAAPAPPSPPPVTMGPAPAVVGLPGTDAARRAIGRIDITGGDMCTGTLVAPRVVLTAAHCLHDAAGRRLRPLVFRPGFDGGDRIPPISVIGDRVASAFDYGPWSSSGVLGGTDYAFLRLETDPSAGTGTIPVLVVDDDAIVGDRASGFVQIGYGRGLGRRQTVRAPCRATVMFDDDTFGHRCGSVVGDSGSPNLLLRDGRWWLVGIESSSLLRGAYDGINTVVSARAFADDLARFAAAPPR